MLSEWANRLLLAQAMGNWGRLAGSLLLCMGLFSMFLGAAPIGGSSSPELRLAPLEERGDAFLVVLAHACQRELVEVHVAGEIVERMREAVDGELCHGNRKRRLGCDFPGERHG